MKLSVNTGFLVNRFPSPKYWTEVVSKLGVKNIQVMPIPMRGIGIAINDRLKRASFQN